MHTARRLATALISSLTLLLVVPALASAAAVLTVESPLVFPDTGINDGFSTQSATVTNDGDEVALIGPIGATAPFAVDAGGSDCDEILALGPEASCNLAVTFDPQAAGLASDKVTLAYISEFGAPDELQVPVSGLGAAGTLQANPPNFNVQPYFYGGQQTQMNVANFSPYTVHLGGATITGPDAGSFSINGGGCENSFLFPGQNCNFNVGFEPNKGGGTYNAQIEFSNDGAGGALVVPVSVESLFGPAASVSPSSVGFGVVEVGSAAEPEVLTVTSVGDFPLQIQQMLIISGSPQNFPVTDDDCSGRILFPTQKCEFTVGFEPGKSGERYASVFMISNSQQPVTVSTLNGEGMVAPNGSVELTNVAKAGVPIVCLTSGYHEVDSLAFQWLRGGSPIAGETRSTYIPVGADVGTALSCRVTATNAVGEQTITSAPSAAVAAAEVGPQGPQGDQGDPGQPGQQGPQGPQGPQGEPGASGEAGATGAQGPTGATGAQGPTGATGPQGPAGANGAAGAADAAGAKGAAGKKGKRGKRGKRGKHGPRG